MLDMSFEHASSTNLTQLAETAYRFIGFILMK